MSNRYSVVRSSKFFGYLVWDSENETFIKKPSGSLMLFEDDTAARIFIDNLTKE